jgi:hypothetical protein
VLSRSNQEEAELTARLRRIVLGDDEQVEWLIAAERRRAPHLSRLDWLRSAVRQWERDNR